MYNKRFKEDILATIEHALVSIDAALLCMDDLVVTENVEEVILRLEECQSKLLKVQKEEQDS